MKICKRLFVFELITFGMPYVSSDRVSDESRRFVQVAGWDSGEIVN
jgi:hypothetical protein